MMDEEDEEKILLLIPFVLIALCVLVLFVTAYNILERNASTSTYEAIYQSTI